MATSLNPFDLSDPSTNSSSESSECVSLQYADLFTPESPLRLAGGSTLPKVRVAYQTYGTLNANKDNAIFICHALTGDAHVAGRHAPTDKKPGWWDEMVGPGRCLDTNSYFLICANVIGGCQGSTGPESLDPETNSPYGLNFPFLTIADMVDAHVELLKSLGIHHLLGIIGGSLGGMQVLEWTSRYPEMVDAAVVLASAATLSAQGIAFNAVGRRAIYADPHFNGGDYYNQQEKPRFGLALARMIAHITYLSEASIEKKFGRRLQHRPEYAFELLQETEFQIESYLHYQGDKFVERFDANSYLYLTRAMDYFDLAREYGSLQNAFAPSQASYLIASYNTDWLFPTDQSQELVTALLAQNKQVSCMEFDSPYGHDAFLLEIEQLTQLVTPFLQRMHEVRESNPQTFAPPLKREVN